MTKYIFATENKVMSRFTQGARQIAGGEGAPTGSCEGSDWEIEIETKSENITNIFAKDKNE